MKVLVQLFILFSLLISFSFSISFKVNIDLHPLKLEEINPINSNFVILPFNVSKTRTKKLSGDIVTNVYPLSFMQVSNFETGTAYYAFNRKKTLEKGAFLGECSINRQITCFYNLPPGKYSINEIWYQVTTQSGGQTYIATYKIILSNETKNSSQIFDVKKSEILITKPVSLFINLEDIKSSPIKKNKRVYLVNFTKAKIDRTQNDLISSFKYIEKSIKDTKWEQLFNELKRDI